MPTSNRANFTSQTISNLAKYPADWPEVEYEINQAPLSQTDRVIGGIIAVPVTPLSRGAVTISSNDTTNLPIIDPNWLTAETDIQVAIQAFRRARAMTETSVIQPVQIGAELSPGKDVTTNDQIHEWIKNNAYMNRHTSYTCRL